MSILKSIFDKIFGSSAQSSQAAASSSSAGANTESARQAPVPPSSAGGSAPMPPPTVDVGPILDGAVAAKGQKLNWKTSIVDLMKALDLDSSLQARQQLAKELHYSGDINESAKMNIWLHGQVMKKLAENGGKVPDDLKA